MGVDGSGDSLWYLSEAGNRKPSLDTNKAASTRADEEEIIASICVNIVACSVGEVCDHCCIVLA